MNKEQTTLKIFPTISTEKMLKISGGNFWKKMDNILKPKQPIP